MRVIDLAGICHEANRAYCESLGDFSQDPWETAPDWARESAEAGVRFHLANPGAEPEASHNEWLKTKREAGWIYGPEKRPDNVPPTHPCCRPFAELPVEQQAKDVLFLSIVNALRNLVTDA